MKNFLSSTEYVESYAEFLIGINDVANARVLFGLALSEAPSKKIWDMFVDFERSHGTMDTIIDAETRRNAACGSTAVATNVLSALLGRHAAASSTGERGILRLFLLHRRRGSTPSLRGVERVVRLAS